MALLGGDLPTEVPTETVFRTRERVVLLPALSGNASTNATELNQKENTEDGYETERRDKE